MTYPDKHSPASQERNISLSELDAFNISLRDTLDLLHDRHTTPTSQIIELGDLRFGRFGESIFSCFLTHDYDHVSGAVELSNPSNTTDSVHLEREPHKKQWQLRNGRTRTNRELLRLLNRSWPSDVANEELAMYAALEDPLDSDVFLCIEAALAPYTQAVTLERTYEFKLQRMDEAGAILTETLRLHRVDADDFTKVDASIDIPYVLSGVPSTLTCTIQSDELSTTTLSAYYVDPETKERVDVPVSSEEDVLKEFRLLIALLLDEKLLDEGSL